MSDNNVWKTEEGWFHRDEVEDQHGPFATEEEAREALRRYCEWLNGPPKKDEPCNHDNKEHHAGPNEPDMGWT